MRNSHNDYYSETVRDVRSMLVFEQLIELSKNHQTLYYLRKWDAHSRRQYRDPVKNFLCSSEALKIFMTDKNHYDNLSLFFLAGAFRNFNIAFSTFSFSEKTKFVREFETYDQMRDLMNTECSRTECWMIYPVSTGINKTKFEVCILRKNA